ncbi:peptidylprolyl isomerase [Paludibacterium yongneupense]|uniref:peptidylprolyl isomerase n=1 Tax=Paludibacterium yongneupense TaxID=400061 RepID=UPI000420690C|nr:peptidylprolyl isomerase [Paludibacterium yongneupense]
MNMKKNLLALLLVLSMPVVHAASVQEVDRIVAVVNKDIITSLDLQQRVAQATRSLQTQHIAPPDQAVMSRQVLDQMINEQLLSQFAANNNVKIDDSEIDQTVLRLAKQNKLDLAGMKAQLARDGTTFEHFRQEVRREMLTARLRQNEVESHVSVSDTEVEQVLKSAQFANNTEYRLANVLVEVPERADGKLLEELSRKANKALSELDAGQAFGKVAATYSNSGNALKGGELGWRPAASLPPDFVALLEKLAPGQHTGVIRTQQGFFIFQLEEKRNNSGPQLVEQYHVEHILVRTNEAVSDSDAKTRILQIRDRILRGASFAETAKLYSDDGSANKGGDLGWVNLGDTVPEFEKAMLALPPNTLSEPVRSPFGWHLIELLGKRTQDVAGEREKMQVKQQIRSRKVEEAYLDWMRQLRDAAFIEDHLDDK